MKTVCIDIDGTISHYIEWVDSKTFGEVLPHCVETIHHLKADMLLSIQPGPIRMK